MLRNHGLLWRIVSWLPTARLPVHKMVMKVPGAIPLPGNKWLIVTFPRSGHWFHPAFEHFKSCGSSAHAAPHLGGQARLAAELDWREAERARFEDAAVLQDTLRHYNAVLCTTQGVNP